MKMEYRPKKASQPNKAFQNSNEEDPVKKAADNIVNNKEAHKEKLREQLKKQMEQEYENHAQERDAQRRSRLLSS